MNSLKNPKKNRSRRHLNVLIAVCCVAILEVAIGLHQNNLIIESLNPIVETAPLLANIPTPKEPLTFADRVADFPWETLTTETDEEGYVNTFSEPWADFFKLVFEGIVQEPFEPIDPTCTAPEMPLPAPCSSSEPLTFTGQPRKTPAKIGHAIQLGFDIDVLEIHLNEIYDVVDKFFIIEWVSFHNGGPGGPKPLAWEAVKHQERFRKFHDKIVHLILDDVSTARAKQEGQELKGLEKLFGFEHFQEFARWEKISQWNELNGHYFNDTDMIGFGDTDEVPSRQNVHLLKHCELNPKVTKVDIGIWFLVGFMDMAFKSDFPIRRGKYYPYTLGDPTFYTVAAANALAGTYHAFPNRERGKSRHFLLGGCHMTSQGYLPYQLARKLSCTECKITPDFPKQLEAAAVNHTWAELEYEFHDGFRAAFAPQNRITPIEKLDRETRDKVIHTPWFLQCNKDRYPTFYGKPDPRTAKVDPRNARIVETND